MEENEIIINNQIIELKRAARKSKNSKQKKRYDAVRLWLQKYSKNEIAKILDFSLRQVYNLINEYKEEGIKGLKLKKLNGRNTKLNREQEEELYKTITEKLPKDVGLEPFCNWTAPLACCYVKKRFNVEFSERGMRDVFYRLKLSYTRPTYVLAKADAEKQAEFSVKLEGIKKLLNYEIKYLLFEDESMIRDYQAIQKTWFAKGKQRIIQTYGKHE